MSRKKNKHGRPTTQDENKLWDLMMADVTPLDKEDTPPPPPAEAPRPPQDGKDYGPRKGGAPRRSDTPPASSRPPRTERASKTDFTQNPELDGRTATRLRKGQIIIEGILDLHGMNQVEAHVALSRFIKNAFTQKQRCVLVITGKGSRSARPDAEKGVLRKRLPEWLALEPLASMVLRMQPARQHHSGEGAFYLYLKRVKE